MLGQATSVLSFTNSGVAALGTVKLGITSHVAEELSYVSFITLEIYVFIFHGLWRKPLVSGCDEESVEQGAVTGTMERGPEIGGWGEGSCTHKSLSKTNWPEGTGIHVPICWREINTTYP